MLALEMTLGKERLEGSWELLLKCVPDNVGLEVARCVPGQGPPTWAPQISDISDLPIGRVAISSGEWGPSKPPTARFLQREDGSEVRAISSLEFTTWCLIL